LVEEGMAAERNGIGRDEHGISGSDGIQREMGGQLKRTQLKEMLLEHLNSSI
jgi:hypothetical protein